MTKVIFTSFDGTQTTVDGEEGTSVMKAAVRNGVTGITGECGGVLSCATCHVIVEAEDFTKLPPMSDQEDQMLDGTADERQDCSRLSCQITLSPELDPIRVTLPEFQE